VDILLTKKERGRWPLRLGGEGKLKDENRVWRQEKSFLRKKKKPFRLRGTPDEGGGGGIPTKERKGPASSEAPPGSGQEEGTFTSFTGGFFWGKKKQAKENREPPLLFGEKRGGGGEPYFEGGEKGAWQEKKGRNLMRGGGDALKFWKGRLD